jgi:hypothetical protein
MTHQDGDSTKLFTLGQQGERYLSQHYQQHFYPAGTCIPLVIAEQWSRQWGIKQIDLALLCTADLRQEITLIEVKTHRQSFSFTLTAAERLKWMKTVAFLQQRLRLPVSLQLAQVRPTNGFGIQHHRANFFVKYFRIF